MLRARTFPLCIYFFFGFDIQYFWLISSMVELCKITVINFAPGFANRFVRHSVSNLSRQLIQPHRHDSRFIIFLCCSYYQNSYSASLLWICSAHSPNSAAPSHCKWQLRSEPWTCRLWDLIIYFRLTIRARCIQLLDLEIWVDKFFFGRDVAAYHLKAEGHGSVFVCEIPCLDPSYCHNSS